MVSGGIAGGRREKQRSAPGWQASSRQ